MHFNMRHLFRSMTEIADTWRLGRVRPVADPEGVPWVPWNSSLEGLPSNMRKRTTYTTLTLELRTSASALAITMDNIIRVLYYPCNNTRVSTSVSRIWCAHGLYVHVYIYIYIYIYIYFQKHVATIETISEVNERIKAYSCNAPSAARGGDMLSVYERIISCALRG